MNNMCFFNRNPGDPAGKAGKRRGLLLALFLLAVAFAATGCSAADFSDRMFPDKEESAQAREADGKIQSDPPKEEEPAENRDAQEYSRIEENKVEEGNSRLSKSDLEKRREEIGLSEADLTGLQESQFGNYYFEQLGTEERILYVECYQILSMQAEEILLSTKNADLLPVVYQCVINDHPELFYLNGYTYTQYTRQEEVQYITFSGRYLYGPAEVAERRKRIDAAVEEKMDRLMGSDDYETVKLVYEDLILSTDYSMDSPDNQNICSVFLDKRSVCNGYAKAAQYLLNYMGIPCIIVNGNANGSSHAWNIVEIGGAYYHMDVTWGDPSYYSEETEEKAGAPDIDYSYLCVTTEEICKNHSIDTAFALPECVSVQDNYFVREGLYLQGYEQERLREIFDAAREQGKNTVIIKASDNRAYQELYDNLIDEQKIFDYFGVYQESGEYRIAYSGNEDLYTISFWE